MQPLGLESSVVLLSHCDDKLDSFNVIKFILKITNKFFEWTFHKWQVKNVKKNILIRCVFI